LQLAKSGSRSRHATDDRDLDLDTGWSQHGRSHSGTGGKSAPKGYDPERIKNFWRHYHGARPQPKSKPLEREK